MYKYPRKDRLPLLLFRRSVPMRKYKFLFRLKQLLWRFRYTLQNKLRSPAIVLQ
jgi:hypothetical protein